MTANEFKDHVLSMLCDRCGWLKKNNGLKNEWFVVMRSMTVDDARRHFGIFWRRQEWQDFYPKPQQFRDWMRSKMDFAEPKPQPKTKIGEPGLIIMASRGNKRRFGWIIKKGYGATVWVPVPEHTRKIWKKKWTFCDINIEKWKITIPGDPAPDDWHKCIDPNGWPICLGQLYRVHGWMDLLIEEMELSKEPDDA